MIVIGGLMVALAVLAFYSRIETARIEARHPPAGAFAIVDGVRLHFVDLPASPAAPGGDDPAILIVHGASGNLNEPMLALRRALEGRHRLVFVDRPGHGYSGRGGARDGAAPDRQAALIAGLADRLGIRRVVVVGHSWGGSVAAAMAVIRPDLVAGLVFVAPATHPWPGGVAWYYRLTTAPVIGALFAHTVMMPLARIMVAGALTEVFSPDPEPDGYLDRAAIGLALRPAEFVANAADVAELNRNVLRLAPHYRRIAAPTVIVTGDRDTVVIAEIHSGGLARDIAGSRLVVLEGRGHMPHHAATEAVVAAIEEVRSAAVAAAVPSPATGEVPGREAALRPAVEIIRF